MTPVSSNEVREFYRAYIARDPARLAALLHDDVEWLISGPVDLFAYYGARRGKAAVIELVTRITPQFLEIKDFDLEELLVQDERAATLCKLSAIHGKTGRLVVYRCAHFMRFRDGRIVSFRALSDSFDAAEQMIGRVLDLAPDAARAAIAPAAGVVAL